MTFREYLTAHEKVSTETLNAAVDSMVQKRRTLFEEMYKSPDKYGVKEEDLLHWMVDWSGDAVYQLTTTRNISCDRDAYLKLGGALACKDLGIMCVKEKDAGLLILTRAPDRVEQVMRLEHSLGVGNFRRAICTNSMWATVYQLEIEPLSIESAAMVLSESLIGRNLDADKVKDSEARNLYNNIINVGIDKRASDVHLIPCSNYCQVLYRVDGVNYEYNRIPSDIALRICNIVINDGHCSATNPNMPVDGKVRFSRSGGKVAGDELDLRISIIPTKWGNDLNIRYLSSGLRSFEELGMSSFSVAKYKHILDLPQGLVVQVGPVGSGKSTTLYAGLSYIHKSLRNIITVEDPVEISMDGISQIDIKERGLTFSDALRAMLRHDPDVAVVGELRDRDTAEEAVRAANTGHLVLTSLHANDSIGSFERLVNLGIEPYSLGEVLVAVMGQRLVRRLCPYCKQEYEVESTSQLAKDFCFPPGEKDSWTLYRAVGCEHCKNTGYRGRVAINEVLSIDPTLRELIQQHATRRAIEAHLRDVKFVSMYADGLSKVVAGVTSLEEMTPLANDRTAYKGMESTLRP